MNIKKEIEKMKSKIALLEEELKKQEKEPENYELYIRNDILSSRLNIGINVGDGFYELGYIVSEGECHFLTQEYQQGNWEVWKQHGYKVVVQDRIEWKGLIWWIDIDGKLIVAETPIGIKHDFVYDFKNKQTLENITNDRGFLKKDSCLRIHLY